MVFENFFKFRKIYYLLPQKRAEFIRKKFTFNVCAHTFLTFYGKAKANKAKHGNIHYDLHHTNTQTKE